MPEKNGKKKNIETRTYIKKKNKKKTPFPLIHQEEQSSKPQETDTKSVPIHVTVSSYQNVQSYNPTIYSQIDNPQSVSDTATPLFPKSVIASQDRSHISAGSLVHILQFGGEQEWENPWCRIDCILFVEWLAAARGDAASWKMHSKIHSTKKKEERINMFFVFQEYTPFFPKKKKK